MKVNRYSKPILLILILCISACIDEPELPPLSIFDPSNPETNGDPFNLKVKIQDQKAVLTWEKPDANYDSFVVYRNSVQLAVVARSESSYKDETIQNDVVNSSKSEEKLVLIYYL